MAKKAPKLTLLCSIECPHCKKILNVIKETEIIVPAEPAEKKERFYADKSTQTTLEAN